MATKTLHPHAEGSLQTIFAAMFQIDRQGLAPEPERRLFDTNITANLRIYRDDARTYIDRSKRILASIGPAERKSNFAAFREFEAAFKKSNERLAGLVQEFEELVERIRAAVKSKTTSRYKEDAAEIIRGFDEEYKSRRELLQRLMKAFSVKYYPGTWV